VGSTATAVDKNRESQPSSNWWRNNQPMTKIELKKASEPLSKYAQAARKDPVIVAKRQALCSGRTDSKCG
jgi:hypothetical protein